MTPLARIQQNFQSCMLYPEQLHDNANIGWVSTSSRASAEKLLSIYSTGYRLRLKEVLANDYPALVIAIGEEKFNIICEHYIKEHPSIYFSLRDFGKNFSAFIKTFEPGQDSVWVYELALFEWTLGQAFDADDVDIFSEKELSIIPMDNWPKLRFIVHPSVHRIDFSWNTAEIWKSLTSETPSEIAAINTSLCSWLIWREHLITKFRSLEQDERLALDALISGSNFSEICEALAQVIKHEDVPLRAVTLLKGWLTQGLITATD